MFDWVFVVPQSHCLIIERFGKFSRVAGQGLRARVPFIERVREVPEWGTTANKRGREIELTEQQTDTDPRGCHTKDNVQVSANASVYWRIVDPVKALYEVDVLPRSIRDVALNALRSNIGAMELDAVLSERQRMNERIAAQLAKVSAKWGVQVTRVEIQELTTNDATSDAMRLQMESERKRRAAVSEAKGRAEAELSLANAERDAEVARAEGKARALELVGDAELRYLQQLESSVGRERAAELLLAQKQLESLQIITSNPAQKVFLPNDLRGMMMFDPSLAGEAGSGAKAGRAAGSGGADGTTLGA